MYTDALTQWFSTFFPMPKRIASKILIGPHVVRYKHYDVKTLFQLNSLKCFLSLNKKLKRKFENLDPDFVRRP